MAYGNNYNRAPQRRGANVKVDKFGNPYQSIRCKQVISKSGEELPIFKGFAELGGKLYKVELSNCNKEAKDGLNGMWCNITKMNEQKRQNMSM